MKTNIILDFLKELKINNNREWFNANKDWYLQAKTDFEQISEALIAEIGSFDTEIKSVQAKDCIFRIYRDIRFSHDKTPYKTHFGVYIAANGGRKSERSGYYLHLDTAGSFLSVGVWLPNPRLLKMLRQSVYDNMDEFKEVIENKQFKQTFDDGWYEEDALKTMPREFPKSETDSYFLRLKHYLVSKSFTEKDLQRPDFVKNTAEIAKIGYPLNKFLNYTVEEFFE